MILTGWVMPILLWESKLPRIEERRIRLECFISRFVKLRFDKEKSGVMVHSDCHKSLRIRDHVQSRFQTPFPFGSSRATWLSKPSPSPTCPQCMEGTSQLYGAVAFCVGETAPANGKGVLVSSPSPQESRRPWGI